MSATIFTAIAPTYDRLNRIISLRLDQRWRRYAVGRLGWERAPEGIYLDLCAGTLDFAATLATAAAASGVGSSAPTSSAAMLQPRARQGAAAGAGDGRCAESAVPGRGLRWSDGRMGSAEPGGPRCGTRRGRPRAQARRPPRDPGNGAAAAARCSGDCTSSISGGCCRGSAARSRNIRPPIRGYQSRRSRFPRRRSWPAGWRRRDSGGGFELFMGGVCALHVGTGTWSREDGGRSGRGSASSGAVRRAAPLPPLLRFDRGSP